MDIAADVAKRMEIVRSVFPYASVDFDNDGQVIIYTDVWMN